MNVLNQHLHVHQARTTDCGDYEDRDRYEALRTLLCDEVNQCERRMMKVEFILGQREKEEHQLDNHCGLILNGGFVEDEEPTSWQRPGYDLICETNAANYVARRSLEHWIDKRSIQWT